MPPRPRTALLIQNIGVNALPNDQKDTLDREFLDDFEILSQFGATPGGGVERQAATDADAEQRHWLRGWLTEAGFTTHYDEIGNQYGLLELVPGAPYVLTGSHLDSQPLAGRYDGAYGVLASAHACRRIGRERDENFQPRYNLAVVNWFNEEGSRFKPSMLGSGVATGKLSLGDALTTTDVHGTTVRSALEATGTVGSTRSPATVAYAEIHIEQGRVLEQAETTIGLVEATWAARKYRYTVTGEQSHTGSTVMDDRKDALYGASLIIAAAREIVDEFAPGALHTSVSELYVQPNSPVVVAREVEFLLDLRSEDQSVIEAAEARLREISESTGAKARVGVECRCEHSWSVLPYQPEGVALAAEVAKDLELTSRRIMTIAGHDSTNLKDVVMTIMLFVPSVAGISHNEAEFTRDKDLCAGVDMLTGVLRRLCADGLEAPPTVWHATVLS